MATAAVKFNQVPTLVDERFRGVRSPIETCSRQKDNPDVTLFADYHGARFNYVILIGT